MRGDTPRSNFTECSYVTVIFVSISLNKEHSSKWDELNVTILQKLENQPHNIALVRLSQRWRCIEVLIGAIVTTISMELLKIKCAYGEATYISGVLALPGSPVLPISSLIRQQ